MQSLTPDPCQLFDICKSLLGKLPETDAKAAVSEMAELLDPMTCWKKYLQPSKEAEASNIVTEEDDEELPAELEQATALQALKAKYNRATGCVFEFLLDLARGKYLADLKDLAKLGSDGTSVGKHVQDAVAASSKEKEGLSDMLKTLTVVIQSFDVTAKSVSLSAHLAAPAPSFMSSLASGGAQDEAAKMERERVWRQVQAERKKIVGLGFAKSASTKEQFQEAFRGSGKVHSFAGSLNAQHRLVVASADLMAESEAEPWANPSMPDKDVFKHVCDFVASASGACDFGVVLDGRLREARRIMVPWPPSKFMYVCSRCFLQFHDNKQFHWSCCMHNLPGRCLLLVVADRARMDHL